MHLVHYKFQLGYIQFNDYQFYMKRKECIEKKVGFLCPLMREILIRAWKQLKPFEVIFIRILRTGIAIGI